MSQTNKNKGVAERVGYAHDRPSTGRGKWAAGRHVNAGPAAWFLDARELADFPPITNSSPH